MLILHRLDFVQSKTMFDEIGCVESTLVRNIADDNRMYLIGDKAVDANHTYFRAYSPSAVE